MSNPPQIKFVAVSRMSDNVILASYSVDKRGKESFKAESKIILDKLQDVYLKAGERQKIKTANGAWFTTCDSKDIFYLILADPDYLEKHAYNMINEVVAELKELKDYSAESASKVENFVSQFLPDLVEKYNDVDNLDNLAATQAQVDKIKDVMSDTINRALENRETFDDLDRKADDLNVLARGFHAGSSELANRMRNRNRQLLIYGSICVGVILFLYFILG